MAALILRSLNQNESGQLDGRKIRRVQLLLFRRRNGGPKEGLLEINRIKIGDDSFLFITITIKWTAELHALVGQFVCVRETVDGQLSEHICIGINKIELRRFSEVREEHEQSGYDGRTATAPDVRYKDLDNGDVYQYTIVGLDRNFVTFLHDELSRMYGLEDNGGDPLQPFPGRIVKYLGSFYVVAAATEENLIVHVLEEGVEFQAAKLRQVRREDVEELGEMALDQRRKEELMKLMKGVVVGPLDPQYAQPLQVSK